MTAIARSQPSRPVGARRPAAHRPVVRWLSGAAALALALSAAGPAWAAPPAADVLPADTLAYLSVGNTRKLADHFSQTALYQMTRDPQTAPLVDKIYGAAVAEFARVEEQIGVGFQELVDLPQGEVCVAFSMPAAPAPPAVTIWLDAGDNAPTMHKLIERAEKFLGERRHTRSEESVGNVTLSIWSNDDRPERKVMWFEKDSTFVIGTNRDELAGMVERWESGAGETLLSNQSFAAIRQRCRGAEGEEPQLEWFVDPIGIAEAALDRSPSGGLGRAILPTLGLDGVRGVGGSVALAVGNFDMVTHAHLLLDTPRAGVVEVLALTDGDVTPEAWVPAEAASYTTVHVDPKTMYQKIGKLVDSFLGDGAFSVRTERAVEPLAGLKFEEEILPAIKGRLTIYQWIEQPIRFDSQASVVALELTDAEQGRKLVEKVAEKYADRLETKSYGGVSFWALKREEAERLEGDDEAPQGRRRVPSMQPSFGIIGNHLLVADRPSSIEQAIVTSTDAEKSLAKSLDYKLIAARIKRQAAGHPPGMVSFERPTEGLSFLYGMASAESTRQNLASAAANNPFLKSVDDALTENPLPPFEVIKSYFAPGGALLTNEDSGFHYMSFTLRRKSATE